MDYVFINYQVCSDEVPIPYDGTREQLVTW